MKHLMIFNTLMLMVASQAQAQTSCVLAFTDNLTGIDYAIVSKNDNATAEFVRLWNQTLQTNEDVTVMPCPPIQEALRMQLIAHEKHFETPRPFVLESERKYAGRYLVASNRTHPTDPFVELFTNTSHRMEPVPKSVADRTTNLFIAGVGCIISGFLAYQIYEMALHPLIASHDVQESPPDLIPGEQLEDLWPNVRPVPVLPRGKPLIKALMALLTRPKAHPLVGDVIEHILSFVEIPWNAMMGFYPLLVDRFDSNTGALGKFNHAMTRSFDAVERRRQMDLNPSKQGLILNAASTVALGLDLFVAGHFDTYLSWILATPIAMLSPWCVPMLFLSIKTYYMAGRESYQITDPFVRFLYWLWSIRKQTVRIQAWSDS